MVREVTDFILEHHLFEREYVRQVRYRGEHEVVNTSAAVERKLPFPMFHSIHPSRRLAQLRLCL